MPRGRSPKRDKAFEIWKDSGGEIPLIEIAEKIGVSDAQIRQWKKQDKWDLNNNVINHETGSVINHANNNVTKSKKIGPPFGNKNAKGHGPPKGNKNAVGNRGGYALPGNKNAEKHGFFAKILPDDKLTREIIEDINIKSPLEILWENIVLQYGIIARAQRLMFVRDQNDLTKVLKREKESSGLHSDSWEKEYQLQFAWDKHATLLKAQSVAMKTLDGLLARYDELLRSEKTTEEQQLRIDKLRSEIAKLKGEDGDPEADGGENFVEALKGKVPEVWDNGS